MSTRFPARSFDIGIAEQHAVILTAGPAMDRLKPVVAIYFTSEWLAIRIFD